MKVVSTKASHENRGRIFENEVILEEDHHAGMDTQSMGGIIECFFYVKSTIYLHRVYLIL